MTSSDIDPLELFASWYSEASMHPEIADASAVNLATATRAGWPSSRMVLLKGYDAQGFAIYTNLGSRLANRSVSKDWPSRSVMKRQTPIFPPVLSTAGSALGHRNSRPDLRAGQNCWPE